MGNRATRFLSLGLGILLLFHGLHTLIYGTEFINDIIVEFYAPYMKIEPCNVCMGVMMMGTEFMNRTITGSSSDYRTYLTYASYGVYMAELIAPILLVFGRFIKIASFVIALDIVLVMILEYKDKFFTLTERGGWSLELPMLYFIIAVTLMLSQTTSDS